MILKVAQISKNFGPTAAVREVSLEAPEGEISGFLGPNGAGKTTLIRMIMDIIKPDRGTVTLGGGLEGTRKNHIGYLPEERGVYTGAKVRETLIYFARLKGLSHEEGARNTDFYLDRMEMSATANLRIGKLSKGNQQKIQLISAIVSKPRLLILDEPFSGLDPVNVALVSQVIRELRDEGVTIVLSTHQMNQAESFCHNIFLMNKGRLILQGPLEDIIQRYSGQSLILETDGPLPESSLFSLKTSENGRHHLELGAEVGQRDLLRWLAEQPFKTHSLTPYRTPLSQIFISEVKAHG